MVTTGAAGTTRRVILRPIGNPLPLGFLGLGGGTLLVSTGRRGAGRDVADEPGIRPQL